MSSYDGESIVLKRCDLIAGRTRFDADLSNTQLQDLHCAIVFVSAFWSAPSLAALGDLAEIVHELDPIGTLTLIVCDIDLIPPLKDTEWDLHAVSGMGEMAWVCAGEVVARHHVANHLEIRETTRSLLGNCSV